MSFQKKKSDTVIDKWKQKYGNSVEEEKKSLPIHKNINHMKNIIEEHQSADPMRRIKI